MLRPLPREGWSFSTAAHLLNRAGFGGTPAEITRLEAMGLERAVSCLVDYEQAPAGGADPVWAKPDPEREQRLRAIRLATPEERRKLQQEEQKAQRERLIELRAWWLQRMASGVRPLQEKMTLFWHGHFATSIEKVRDPYLMWRQNALFRRLALGDWRQLLLETSQDPAMLLWLDQAQSRKQHPNENFAREVMELFTLGEGHYTERDVTEAARSLTGWSYDRARQEFVQRPLLHDAGLKTIFGQTGYFHGEDVISLLVSHPQGARFITSKLWVFFAGEAPSNALAEALAATFRTAGHNFKPLLRAIFLSEEFYAPSVIRNQVKSPVQWLVGSVRMLERPLPPPLVCAGLTRNLGQDLFAPPNVKGWDGGLSWITTNTLLARYNEAATLIQGDLQPLAALHTRPNGKNNNPPLARRLTPRRLGAADVDKLFSAQDRASTPALVAALERRLLQARLTPEQERVLRQYLADQQQLGQEAVRNALRLVMSTPEYQVT
jgi:uncharacterized protein (DUF1800 family)